MKSIQIILVFFTAFSSCYAASPSLFELVVAGANCKQTINNGLICDYNVGEKLKFSIKDAGGRDEIIGFHHSDINDEYYAIYYFGCVVVVPGYAKKNQLKDESIFISPKNGRVYRTKQECQAIK